MCSAVQYCVLYRPNVTPGTKRGVGAHVCPARQSQDCLRVHPFRAPPLFAAVRSAAGSVQPTVARGASCVQLVRSADLRLHVRLEMHKAPVRSQVSCRTSPHSVALFVVYPVSLLRRIRALEPRKARLGAMSVLRVLPCADNFMVHGKVRA